MGVEHYSFNPLGPEGRGSEEKKPDTESGGRKAWKTAKRHLRKAAMVGVAALELSQTGDRPVYPAEEDARNRFYEDSRQILQTTLDNPRPAPYEQPRAVTPESFMRRVNDRESLDGAKREQLLKDLEYLSQEYGADILWYLRHADNLAAEKAELMPAKPEISGFDQLGIDEKKLAKLFSQEFYPQGTIDGNISAVKYHNAVDEDFARSVQSVHGKRVYPAASTGWMNNIAFYKTPNAFRSENILRHTRDLDLNFGHEAGHANDWERKVNLKLSERANFLAEATRVYNQMESEWLDSGKKAYSRVSHYQNITHPNPQLQKYLRLTEFWADNCLAASTEGFWQAENRQDPDALKSLMEKWYHRDEPKFNVKKARDDQFQIYREILDDRDRQLKRTEVPWATTTVPRRKLPSYRKVPGRR